MTLIKRFLKDEQGATAIEYGLIAAGITLAIIASVQAFSESVVAKFEFIETKVNGSE